VIYYHDITLEENNFLYGPGKRLVIWTQGCSIRCFGCTNAHLYSREGAKRISSDALKTIVLQASIEGITFHGGEPSDQFEALLPVVEAAHQKGLNVVLFTGREIEDLGSPLQQRFLESCDLVKCGPFDITKLDRYLHLRGSTNQRIIKCGNRLANYEIEDGFNVVLLDVDNDGIIVNKGFPDERIDQMIDDVSMRTENQNDSPRQVKRNRSSTG
jgi:anaerobic ribonucleoside-triphosphate reductase activating protein